MQKIMSIIWPILFGILLALFIIREFPESFLQKNSINLNYSATKTDDLNNPLSKKGFAYAVRQAAPTVVNIYTSNAPDLDSSKSSIARKNSDLLENKEFNKKKNRPINQGSGVIINHKGYIITLQHVIQNSNKIIVELRDGRTALAKIIGIDPETDLAVLSINLSDLPVAVTSRSPGSIGDIVLAIGNPFGVGQTVTMGILSATGRNRIGLNAIENFIQTDAAINPGNSGGALVNIYGELIGINSSIFSREDGADGINFAIPITLVNKVLKELVEQGSVTRGWLGIEPRTLTPELSRILGVSSSFGVIVNGLHLNSPAIEAGLELGDIVTHIDGRPIKDGRSTLEKVVEMTPGQKVSLDLLRNGQRISVFATIGTRPRIQN